MTKLQKPAGWDEATAFTGEFETLPAGAYIATIKNAKVDTTRTGKECIILAFDIAEGEYKGFYQRQFDGDTRTDKKWRGTYMQVTEGNSIPFYKGMVTSIELSNPGYKWDFDVSTLKGKQMGVLMGREQYVGTDGTLKWAVKCMAIRTVKAVKDGTAKAPEDKLVQGAGVGGNRTMTVSDIGDFEEIEDDGDLPF